MNLMVDSEQSDIVVWRALMPRKYTDLPLTTACPELDTVVVVFENKIVDDVPHFRNGSVSIIGRRNNRCPENLRSALKSRKRKGRGSAMFVSCEQGKQL